MALLIGNMSTNMLPLKFSSEEPFSTLTVTVFPLECFTVYGTEYNSYVKLEPSCLENVLICMHPLLLRLSILLLMYKHTKMITTVKPVSQDT